MLCKLLPTCHRSPPPITSASVKKMNQPNDLLEKIKTAKDNNLKSLDLSLSQLTEIPEEVFELANLECLYLRNNALITLPEEIIKLSRLTKLDLSGNTLTKVPESIGKLTRLRELNLMGNSLTDLPESIGKLTKLRELNLMSNAFTEFPASVTGLRNLTRLYLSYNFLVTLPDNLNNLSKLTGLYLSSNALKEFPESITKIPNLKQINLSHNAIKKISESIINLSNVSDINLSRNALKELPENIIHLPNLKQINLSRNLLEEPPQEVAEKGINSIRAYFQETTVEREEETSSPQINPYLEEEKLQQDILEAKDEPKLIKVKLPFAFRRAMYLTYLFVLVLTSIAVWVNFLPPYFFVLSIVGITCLIVGAGIVLLCYDKRLAEASTIDLIKIVVKQLPLVGNLLRILLNN